MVPLPYALENLPNAVGTQNYTLANDAISSLLRAPLEDVGAKIAFPSFAHWSDIRRRCSLCSSDAHTRSVTRDDGGASFL